MGLLGSRASYCLHLRRLCGVVVAAGQIIALAGAACGARAAHFYRDRGTKRGKGSRKQITQSAGFGLPSRVLPDRDRLGRVYGWDRGNSAPTSAESASARRYESVVARQG